MANRQRRARGLGRPLRDVLAAIDEPERAGLPLLTAPPALGGAIALIADADPSVIVGWATGPDLGVTGEVDERHDAVWALLDDLLEVRRGVRPVATSDDGRWHAFAVTAGEQVALGVVTRAGSLSADTCALVHHLASDLRRRVG